MSLGAVRAGLATRLATISGLRVFLFVPTALDPPAAIVEAERGTFLQYATSTGSNDLTMVVTVIVSGSDNTGGQTALDAYLAETGAGSIKAAIEGDITLAGAADYAEVIEARNVGSYPFGGTDYFGCQFVVAVATR